MDGRAALFTARLELRPIGRDDIPAIVAGLNDYQVSKWLTVVPYPYSAAHGAAFLADLETRGPFDGFGLTRDGGPVMGVVGIGTGTGTGLGYWLARRHHGHGYMTEAARALVGHYFAVSGADALTSGCFEGNAASAGVLAKLGFRHSHDERVRSRARGAEITIHRMHLGRADWIAANG